MAKKSATGWIDISVPLNNDMVHGPNVSHPRLTRLTDVNKGEKVTLTELHFNAHAGTHVDAPLHFIKQGCTIDQMPLDAALGPARVIEIQDAVSIKVDELAPYDIQSGERILFKTRNSAAGYFKNSFNPGLVYLATESAHYLVERGVKLIGIDAFAIGSMKSPRNMLETHRILLGAGIYIIETLDLSAVKPGRYDLICLPLLIQSCEAAPARAIVRERR